MRARTHSLLAGGRGRGGAGFTLVEVLVTVALLGVVMAMLLIPVINSLRYFRTGTARADAQTAARLALDAVARELTEAMYVQLDMYDTAEIAFVPPLRVDPDDPNSEVVTPPRPDWSRVIRYWRALYDPTFNYNPTGQVGLPNTFFLARTEVPDPLNKSDPWNRWNDTWAWEQDGDAAEGVTNWAPISRAVHKDVDYRVTSGLVGARNATLQPGYPYLAVQYALSTGAITQAEATRIYRDRVVAMTPNATDYDVSQLEFGPVVVAGEWLRPVEGPGSPDYSVYRARYPLWRLGAAYTGWAQLSEDPNIHLALEAMPWARDPFLLVYRYNETDEDYDLSALAAFDPRTRTMKVIDPYVLVELYDSGHYPYRGFIASTAFGVDWIDGSLRCSFPPPGTPDQMAGEEPAEIDGTLLTPIALPVSGQMVYEAALMTAWGARTPPETLEHFLLPDTLQVRVDTDGIDGPDRTLTQVFCAPRPGSNEFQVGLDLPDDLGTDPLQYGFIRLPELLSGAVDPTVCFFYVDFRWRSNGVVPAGMTLEEERPDLVSAYYRTAAVVDIKITVSRADPGAPPSTRISQSTQLTRRVKLRNLLREVRYEE
jgi:prepilin-type N-terminal cleavage/methylation domain-containing protein